MQVAPAESLGSQATATIDGIPMLVRSFGRLDTRFDKSFETVATSFEALPRFFFEPDGSFVWVVESDRRYQIDGSLYDDGVRLLNVELKGTCDGEMLDRFLVCLGWPTQTLVFQLVEHGVYLSESEFRQHYIG